LVTLWAHRRREHLHAADPEGGPHRDVRCAPFGAAMTAAPYTTPPYADKDRDATCLTSTADAGTTCTLWVLAAAAAAR
jgi:hypothetical protein